MFLKWISRVERIGDVTSSRPRHSDQRPERDHVKDVLWFGAIEFHEEDRIEWCPKYKKPRVIQENFAVFASESLRKPWSSTIVQPVDRQLVTFCHSPHSTPQFFVK